jgi:hypothetical protein
MRHGGGSGQPVEQSLADFGACAEANPVMAGTAIHGFLIFAKEQAQYAKWQVVDWPFRPLRE